jgi:hypothetical protein
VDSLRKRVRRRPVAASSLTSDRREHGRGLGSVGGTQRLLLLSYRALPGDSGVLLERLAVSRLLVWWRVHTSRL